MIMSNEEFVEMYKRRQSVMEHIVRNFWPPESLPSLLGILVDEYGAEIVREIVRQLAKKHGLVFLLIEIAKNYNEYDKKEEQLSSKQIEELIENQDAFQQDELGPPMELHHLLYLIEVIIKKD